MLNNKKTILCDCPFLLVWIGIITTDIDEERQLHVQRISDRSLQMAKVRSSIDELQSKWEGKATEMKRHLEFLVEQREANLKGLIELRLSWQQRENKKELATQEKARLKRLQDDSERQHEAAIILQNKIRMMYLSKVKKAASKPDGKTRRSTVRKAKKTKQ